MLPKSLHWQDVALMGILPVLLRLQQEDHQEYEGSLGYKVRFCLKPNTSKARPGGMFILAPWR